MHFACTEERYSDFYAGYFTSKVNCANNRKKVDVVLRAEQHRALAGPAHHGSDQV